MVDIPRQRLLNQHIAQPGFEQPGEALAWLGAAQAQDYYGAKWALGLRTQGATDEQVERAFNEGALLRTHLLRPTWHFVTPEDIGWLLALTAPRVQAANAAMYRRLGLDGQVVGSWKRTLRKDAVVIEINIFRRPAEAEERTVVEAAQRYGEFLQLPVELVQAQA
jgi:hypothetical protein